MTDTGACDNRPAYTLTDVNALWGQYLVGLEKSSDATLGKFLAADPAPDIVRPEHLRRSDARLRLEDQSRPPDAEQTVLERHERRGTDDLETVVERSEHSRTAFEFLDTISAGQIQPDLTSEHSEFGFDIYQKFRLLRRINEGSMGLIIEAYQTSIDRQVAIKMIKPEFSCDENARQHFFFEATVLANLTHPNIIPIYDMSNSREVLLFYVMQYVQGASWADVLRTKTEAENLEILRHVCDAVSFSHAQGILHRDIKPENVMLGEYGKVFLTDWGVAVSYLPHGKGEPLTPQTSSAGTPAYMAPEMARHANDQLGPWSDQYLLGGILYEIVTGLKPHRGKTTAETLLQAMQNELQPTEQQGELLEIARKAMATNPKERYDSVQSFQQALRAYQAHRESLLLTSTALACFKRAQISKRYDDYAKSLFGYQDALALWPDNQEATDGIEAVSLAYAQQAYTHNDYDLGTSLLNPARPHHRELIEQAVRAQKKRFSRKRWVEVLTYGFIGLQTAIIVILLYVLFF